MGQTLTLTTLCAPYCFRFLQVIATTGHAHMSTWPIRFFILHIKELCPGRERLLASLAYSGVLCIRCQKGLLLHGHRVRDKVDECRRERQQIYSLSYMLLTVHFLCPGCPSIFIYALKSCLPKPYIWICLKLFTNGHLVQIEHPPKQCTGSSSLAG